jgi:hypothetical protein
VTVRDFIMRDVRHGLVKIRVKDSFFGINFLQPVLFQGGFHLGQNHAEALGKGRAPLVLLG